jgi:antitoxin ParD1/3/4
MAAIVEEKVQSGHYASVSEVLRDGVRALIERDAAFEKWLREEVVTSVKQYEADPASGIPAKDIMRRLRAYHAETKEAS